MKSLGQAYAVVGNHDTSPVNSFPPAAVDTTMTSQWAFDVMSSEWGSVSAKNNFASKFNQCCNSF
jgi:sphingomyelin phosphodiesterase